MRLLSWGSVFLFISISFSQTPFDLYNASLARYAAHDYAGYLKLAEKAKNADPERPEFVYNLARAYALNGNKVQCIERLDDLSVFGFDYNVDHDSDFVLLWNHSLLTLYPPWEHCSCLWYLQQFQHNINGYSQTTTHTCHDDVDKVTQ